MNKREQQKVMNSSDWPQYLVESQHADGYFEGKSPANRLCYFSNQILLGKVVVTI
jgi:hypothetical protein